MACLTLISIMLLMATRGLSSASRIFLRLQKTQYAQSILDTAMTELRNVAGEATGYVKIYENGTHICRTARNHFGHSPGISGQQGVCEAVDHRRL